MSKDYDPEAIARMMAACYRLAQLLNIPIEDAVTVFKKVGDKLVDVSKNKPA